MFLTKKFTPVYFSHEKPVFVEGFQTPDLSFFVNESPPVHYDWLVETSASECLN